MKNINFQVIINDEECDLDMSVTANSIIDACGYVPSELIIAYYENGIFYEDSTKAVEIQGKPDTVYIDNYTGVMYIYDGSTLKYKAVGGVLETYTKDEIDNKITEKVSAIVAGAPEDFDTLKEMSDWIAGHEGTAAEMNTAIKQNSTNIANIQAEIGDMETVLSSVVEV